MGAFKILRVNHTGITVSDIGQAIRFFCDGLGGSCTEPVLYSDPFIERVTGIRGAQIIIAQVTLPDHEIELLQWVAPQDRRQSGARPCDPGHLHISLLVDGIEALVQHMGQFGFEPAGPVEVRQTSSGIVKSIYTYGFDNVVVELMDEENDMA